MELFKKRIIIIRERALGDVILIQPILTHFLNNGYHVTLISEYAEIFAGRPDLTRIKKKSRIQLLLLRLYKKLPILNVRILNLNGSYESQPELHVIDAYELTSEIKLEVKELSPDWFYSGINIVDDEKIKSKPIIYFHLQAPSQILNYRSIFGIDWKLVEETLLNLGYDCVELISKRENYIPILNKFVLHDVLDIFDLIKNADLFIGLDSGPSYVANLYFVDSFIFYGSVNSKLYLDFSRFKGIIFQNHCEFAGCYHTVKGSSGAICRIVGNEGQPPCCTFDTQITIERMVNYLEMSKNKGA